MYLVTEIPHVHLFASQHYHSTQFMNISTINTQAYYIQPNTYSLLQKLSYTFSNLYTVFIHIKAGLKYTQVLKYMLGSAAEWKK